MVVADGFNVSTTASLDEISVAVDYEDFPAQGITGTAPMLLSLLSDNNDSPGSVIESWTIPLSPADTKLTVVTVNSTFDPLLVAGQQYWLSEVPTNSATTGIGWGLASAGYPGIQLPIAESTTGMNNGWEPTSSNLADEFEVAGNVVTPEPGTIAICALGLVPLILWKRMRIRRAKAI